jgi:hypothetical protein
VDIASFLCARPIGSVTFINANNIAGSLAPVVFAAILVSHKEAANYLCGPSGPGFVQVPRVDIASFLCVRPNDYVTLINANNNNNNNNNNNIVF